MTVRMYVFWQLDDHFVSFDRQSDKVQVRNWIRSVMNKNGPSISDKARWLLADWRKSAKHVLYGVSALVPRVGKDEARLVGSASVGLLVLLIMMSPKVMACYILAHSFTL